MTCLIAASTRSWSDAELVKPDGDETVAPELHVEYTAAHDFT
jgi:hypothetical protein